MSIKGQVYKKRDWSERFWKKVNKDGPNGCWEWVTKLDINGYGRFYYNNRVRKAHTVIWEYLNGGIQKGMCVLHRCDNPKCVNPEHIFLGSHKKNMVDKKQKGRAKGSAVKLTHNQNYRLKRLISNPNFTNLELSKIFKIHTETISQFKRRVKADLNLYKKRQSNCINNLSFQHICNRYGVSYKKLWYEVNIKLKTKQQALISLVGVKDV